MYIHTYIHTYIYIYINPYDTRFGDGAREARMSRWRAHTRTGRMNRDFGILSQPGVFVSTYSCPFKNQILLGP